ncbi:GntR family transcriptional regulator [Paenibacillus sp. HB172176]|uniref:GntR family transcriptional regulator n=1 Tax=Paenibacillus sp. HB172176 TaxID=2493690 RepID=UPI00143ADFEA|nr:GntR family transcriptional regulator [Paenibacillus sp. HB172176]
MLEPTAPKYKQLKEQILAWIVKGEFQPNEKLPSENEMSKLFGLSRQTVRQALGDLEQEGWLYREQGKGTFVALQSAPAGRHGISGYGGVTIGMITTHISDYIFPTIVRGVESKVREKGARLLLASTDNEKEKERQSLESMLREPLSGLIIEPTRSAEGNPNFNFFLALEAMNIPYIMLNERYSDVDAPCLRVDDELGGYRAAQYLIAMGHIRIAGFFKTDDFQGVHRMRGFVRAHREAGLAIEPQLLLRYRTEEKASKPGEALAALLRRSSADRPTALVCYNDELAVRMLDVVRLAGLAVPEQLSIVGFDDATLATATETKLTTLAHPKSAMGEDAVEMLVGLMDKPVGGATTVADKVYEPILMERDSVCPPLQH